MRWVRFRTGEQSSFGVVRDEGIHPVSLSWPEILEGRTPELGKAVNPGEVELLAPLGRPGKIVAIGLNYQDHCREQNIEVPERPLIFTKFTTSIVGPEALVQWSDEETRQVDFEAELAVVMGRPARNVAVEKALDHVFGYTAANDVSARDLQFSDKQWVRGKSLDTFCPLGPALVARDGIPDPQGLEIRCRINGETLQDSSTSEMVFPVAELIAFCSRWFTFEPGDVLLTGTPHGVGVFRDPPVFLKDGDRMEVEIESIGVLRNTCRVASAGIS